MRKEVKYIAEDGKKFFDANECLAYESNKKFEDTIKMKKEMIRLDDFLWTKYVGEYTGDTYPRIHDVDLWLKADIESILMRCDKFLADTKDKIVSEIESRQYGKEILMIVNMDSILETVLIRKDFKTAFSKVKKGSELSRKLNWSFSKRDLKELAKLHKSNKCRRKIEELLTDCNFHKECVQFVRKEYDEYLKG